MASKFLDSTIAQILEDIISQISFEGESHSNIADILLSILNQTPYEEEPKSVIADLFLKLKAKIEGEPFDPDDKEYTSNIAKILVSILNETEYTEEPKSRIAELLLELKEELESFIEVTVSGSVVSFNTKVSKPLVNLTADINQTETGSGAKSPQNPYVIGGHTGINVVHCGVNLFDKNGDYRLGYINDSGEFVSNSNIRLYDTPIFVRQSTYAWQKSGGTLRIVEYTSNGTFVRRTTFTAGSGTFTPQATTGYILINPDTAVVNSTMFEYGSTVSAYEPYSATTHHADFGQNVYGGELNVTTGVLTIDRGLTFAPTIEDFTVIFGTKTVQLEPNDISHVNVITNDIISETASGQGFNKNYSCCHNSNIIFLTFPDDYSVAEYNELVDGTKILYPLATPITIQLDPIEVRTLLGANNIYHDCNGNIEVTYLDKRS